MPDNPTRFPALEAEEWSGTPITANRSRRRRRSAQIQAAADVDPLAGTYVDDPESNGPVTVWRVNSPWGVKALIYKTRIIEDDDGDPEAYAAPISDTNPAPRGGHINETSIFNAAGEKTAKAHPKVIFHADNTQNTFHWTGVHSRAETAWDVGENPGTPIPGPHHGPEPGTTIDFRPFLKSVDGTFPIFRPGTDFYARKRRSSDEHGNAINARVVPYGAASAKLRELGGIGVGDVRAGAGPAYGLASPSSSPIPAAIGRSANIRSRWRAICSAAGIRIGVGEFHRLCPHQRRQLRHPGSVPTSLAGRRLISPSSKMSRDIAERLAVPQFDEPLYIGRSFVPKVRFGRSFKGHVKGSPFAGIR